MCKHFNLLTIGIILAFIGLTSTKASGDYICGDANGDSDVNVSDAVHIINYVFVGGSAPDPLEVADCNCDTEVNVSDAVFIINYVFVSGFAPCDPDGDGIPNRAPVCSLPSSQTYVVCGDTTFVFPVSATDEDGNLNGCMKVSGVGMFDGSNWTFTTTGEGVYTGIFECVDSCGATCTDTVDITVTANTPPVCNLPADTSFFVCADTTFSFAVSASDADGNLDSCALLSGDGSFDGSYWTFTSTGDGIYTGIFECVDSCGATCTDTVDITVTINAPPVCNLPADTSFFVCADTTFSFAVSASDADGNLDSCALLSGGGSFNGSYWTFTTTGEGVYTGIFECVDSCGATCTDTVDITVTANTPPVCNLPADTSFFVCADTTFNFPISVTDDDDNAVGCVKVSGAGTYNGSVWTFTTSGAGVYSATFECSDSCGQICGGTVDITVTYNSAPVCNLPEDQSFFVCGDTTFSFPVSASDIDGNLTGCTKLSGPGTYNGTTWTFITSGPGVYSGTFQCADACGQTCGGTVTITVEDTCTVTDIDGNVYQTVIIGSQVWMAENLKVTHYRNGNPIPNVTGSAWESLSTGAYCNYNDDEGNVATYGRLYNWYAVDDSRNIAPEGWHVASDAEWKQLEMYLGMSQAEADATGHRGTDEGGKLKEAGTTHWWAPNNGATNESGFTGLPGGWRVEGNFMLMGNAGYFWSSTGYGSNGAWYRSLGSTRTTVYRNETWRRYGFSVRCVRD